MATEIACSGNIMTLLDYATVAKGSEPTMENYAFCCVFQGFAALTTAPELSATTLANYCYQNMFKGCTSLTAAPKLSATTLAEYCYQEMFGGCTSLTKAPALNATTLERSCYKNMFKGCTSLTSAPELQAMELKQACYNGMFYGCTSLTKAPALDATTLAQTCYSEMFMGCTSLTSAPALPATKLEMRCYDNMFNGCTSLTKASELSAMTLASQCCMNMFNGCTSLTKAPELPATTLALQCYDAMFKGCTSLTSVPELNATTLANYCYRNMFNGCTSLEVNTADPGKKWKLPSATTQTSWNENMFSGIKAGSTVPAAPAQNTTYYIASAPKETDCITFASAASFTLKTYNGSKGWDGKLWTSTDQLNWTEWNGGQVSAAQAGGTGDYNLYVRGNTANTKISDNNTRWVLAGSNIACTGNIETLRGATGDAPSPTAMASSCYGNMFYQCKVLTAAPAFPAMTLAGRCYAGTFTRCEALKTAPALPATTLADACYNGMFSFCTSLTSAPALPATELKSNCYQSMFYSCTSLTSAPALSATEMEKECYKDMFGSCTSLKSAPALPATELKDSCYANMFSGCTSLTAAPALPATTLADSCYDCMFSGCKSLIDIPEFAATGLAYYCCGNMFNGCTSLTSAPALPATTLTRYCYVNMFKGCTSLIDIPALPATELADSCYQSMFNGCTSLKVNKAVPGKEWKIPVETTTAEYWGRDMFYDTAGDIPNPPDLNTTYYIASAPVEFTVADVANATKEVEGATLVEGNTYKAAPGAAVTVTYTANEGYVFANNKKTSVVETAAAKDITITTTTECVAAVAKIGDTYYATLMAAVNAVKDGDTVTLLKAAEMGSIAFGSYTVTLDLNGQTLTVNKGSEFSNGGNLTIVNGVAGQGGLAIDGTVEVDNELDISTLTYGAGGLLANHDGKLFVAIDAKAKLLDVWAAQGLTPNWLAANREGFLEAEEDAMVQMGETVYTADEDGFFASEDTVAKATVTTAGGAGQITYVEAFDTLAAAVAAANAGTTVTLLANAELDAMISVDKAVTLDIGAYDVTPKAAFAGNALFALTYGADFTVNGTTGTVDASPLSTVLAAIKLPTTGTGSATNRAKLTVNANLTGNYYAIVGSGSRGYTDIVVNGGTITAAVEGNNQAIFNPQGNSTVTVNGGTLTGHNSAVEMRGGTLTVNGGTLTSTATSYSVVKNKSGSTTVGAAVAVAQHTTKGDIAVTIAGGTISGFKSVSVANPQGNTTENVAVMLGAATYTGDLAFSADGNATVTNNGAQIAAPAGYAWNKDGKLQKAAVKIGEVYYIALQDAFDAVKDGETIELLKDVAVAARIDIDPTKSITLDANGKRIDVAAGVYAFVYGGGDTAGDGVFTVTGEGTFYAPTADSTCFIWARRGNIVVENGSFSMDGSAQCVYADNGCTATINGGTFVNRNGADVLNVHNTRSTTTDIQCYGGSFSRDPELGDDSLGGSFLVEGYGSVEAEGLWQVVALPVATATKLTASVPEGVDMAYRFSTDESAEGSPFAAWEANFTVTFDKAVAAGTVELAGQYGAYEWTKMPLTKDLAADEAWKLLPAGTVNFAELCAMKDFFCAARNLKQINVGTGVNVELTLSNGTKTYAIATVDDAFTREVAPKAKIEELAEKPTNLDVAYNCLPETDQDEYYNGWQANITVSFDKAVTAGSLVLSGQYNTYEWTPYPITEDLAANEEMALLPDGTVHYQDLYAMLGGFNCGVKNLDGDNVGTKMTVKIVITNGEKTIVMGEQGYTLAFNLPETTATKLAETPEGIDAAYKFSTTESGEGSFFAKWEANFDVSFDKPVKAGTVELAGKYGAYDWTPMALTKDLAADEKWTLLPAGQVAYEDLCKMQDFFCAVKNLANENIGTGVKVELTLSDGTKTYVVNTVDETLNQLGSPTAAIEEVTPAGKNLDAQFNCQMTSAQEARFDKWGANITVTFDQAVKAGTVVLAGQYGAYEWTPMPLEKDLAAGETWTLLEDGKVAVEDLYKMAGGFNCGVKNVSQANVGAKMTVKVVVNDGTKTFESATKEYTLAFNPPTATVTKMEPVPAALDDAYTFAADEVDQGDVSPFKDWTAEFYVSFDQAVAAETVTLSGSYAAWQQGAWTSYNLPALAANEEFAVLKGFGLDQKLTYAELCNVVKAFSCGVLNNLKANEGKVLTVKLVLAKGEESCTITTQTSTLVKKSEAIDIGGGMTAKDFGNGDIEIAGSGELSDISALADRSITNLVIGAGVTKIAADTFKNNRDLRTITVGADCTAIGENAFGKVRNVTNVVVKGGVTVGDYAFLRCNSLQAITFESMPTFGKTPFALHSAIYMKDGMPQVYAVPQVIISGYRQALMGSNDLADPTSWTEITDESEKANYHFFKIEMVEEK